MKRGQAPLFALLVMGAALTSAAQGPDRSVPPKTGEPPALKLPQIEKLALSNGLPVWLVEHHEVPLAQVNLIVKSGSAADPTGKFGVGSFAAAMLDEGAGTRSALELAEAVEFLGAQLSTASSFDQAAVRLSVPAARLQEAVDLMADVALRPTFPDAETERLRKQRLTELLQARDDPAVLVQFAFLAHYQPANAALIVVGDVTRGTVMPLMERAFGTWKTAPAPSTGPAVQAAPQLTDRHVYVVDKPGAAQSQIRMGWVGVARSTPELATLDVLNTILGGSFTSRLNSNLREQHGYSYGAFSSFDMRRAPGPFYAGAGVQTDKTAEALREFFKELDGIQKPVPADELEKAKSYVALRFPGEFETTGDLARKLEELVVYDLPESTFSTYIDRVRAVTADAVQKAAMRYIQPENFAVVVVGDRSTIEPAIRAANVGPLTVVPAERVFR
ncbi:MAG: insulinase family protein [Acidobacteria bacterium]|nr:insulinase family protein [Acidobacteriota bacterium]